jgi:hypothetical protein
MDWIDPRYSFAKESQESDAEPAVRGKKENTKGGKSKLGKAQAVAERSESSKPATSSKPDKSSKPNKSDKTIGSQVNAALAQPLDVWTSAFGHALNSLNWPNGCSLETSLLWSTVMQEQAEVLVRAGMSAKKLAALVTEEEEATTDPARAKQVSEVVGLMDQSLESRAFQWLDAADAYPYAALGVAAVAWHLPDHAARPSGEWLTQWVQALLDRIACFTPDPDAAALCSLVLQCEMPLLIGVATTGSKRTVLLEASKAMDNLAELLERSEDTPAAWLAHGATYLRASLASVLRCRVLANGLGLRKWYPPQQKALAELLTHAARWARPDGSQLLAASRVPPRSKAIWDALVKQTRKPQSMLTAMSLVNLTSVEAEPRTAKGPASKKSNGKARHNQPLRPKKLPEPTFFSEDAAGAVLQSHWYQKGSRLAIDYSDTQICLEVLGPKGKPILAGEWTAHVDLDGQSQLQLDEWVQSCWFSDDDVDYLELEAKFGQYARVQRQIMLFREDRWMFVGDALLCEEPGDWTLTSHLPLAAGTRFEPDPKNTEGTLCTSAGGRCLTLPLYLPEWRRQATAASLTSDSENLLVRQSTSGKRRLFSPMLISLCNRHAKKPFTWRRLTVGEDLRIVGADEATAYRVQSGKDQFLFYRTLAPPLRRTALGLHTLAEFYAARFNAENGDVDTLIEVEANVD